MGNATTTAAAPALKPAGVDGIKELVELATRASGVEIVTIKAPAGLRGVPAEIPAAVRHGVTPELTSVASLFASWRTRPEQRLGTAQALTLDSFVALVNRHKTDNSAIFADTGWKNPGFTAVIDYHPLDTAEGADNGKHRVGYSFPLSEEWKAWVGKDSVPMKQDEFAAFLEDRIADLSSPSEAEAIALSRDFATTVATPSELIQLSRGLQVNVDAVVKNIVTLQSGEGQIAWEETHRDASGQPLKVPGIFILSIAPFFMGEKIRVPVRLRYRKAGQGLVWFYQIYRPDQFVTERVREDLERAGRDTGLPAYEGQPEMAGAA